ncbi:MAG: hypothetical protein KGN01_05575 [Patescibacteria group bacterium]|nr:hypothetical protein [Patescibacteria group bacterium]
MIREPSYEHLPVGNDYDSLVDFVEYLRLGQLKVAFRGLSDKTYKSIFKNNVTRQMTPFDVNPEQFIVDITDFANYITECGL